MTKSTGITALAGMLSALLCTTAFAQTPAAQPTAPSTTQPAPTYRCDSPESKQFDFWVGEWEAAFRQGNQDRRSRNVISKSHGGCVIVENFNGWPASPLVGLSVSTFERNAGKWKQTWVDNNASYLDFEGEFKEGRMTLSRTANQGGRTFLQRMVWFDIHADKFNWNWERSDDGGKTWTVIWAIAYKRIAQ
jgi:hypothetical protein